MDDSTVHTESEIASVGDSRNCQRTPDALRAVPISIEIVICSPSKQKLKIAAKTISNIKILLEITDGTRLTIDA